MTELPITRRQRDILQFLEGYLREHSIAPTLEEIAQHLGVSRVTVFGHVRELERKGIIQKGPRGLSRGLRPLRSGPASVRSGAQPPAPVLPILGRIAAGAPIEEIHDPEELDLARMVPEGAEVFALRVEGESMIEDSIRPGDLVLVERRATARNGETVVAVLPDGGGVTLKRLYREKGRIRLQPSNSRHEPIFVGAGDLEIRGIVIGVVRRY
jgi:repressor LexA